MLTTESTTTIIVSCGAIALIWAFLQFTFIANTKLSAYDVPDEKSSLTATQRTVEQQTIKLKEVYTAISEGAEAFLRAEYSVCSIFVVAFAILVFSLIAWGQNVSEAFLTTLSFVLGAVTSILSGYIGMKVAVFSNVRTTINAQRDGYEHCFNTAFRAGSVMGFALNGLGLLVLYITLCIYRSQYKQDNWDILMECISGYGLGGSTIAMFGRVGGGIYTKAADVGADLVGKVVHGIPEDDPRNPATIADNVGDNVGDVAGMGADLFGSFAESTCAALVIAAQTEDIRNAGWGAVCFPIGISAIGVLVCLVTSFIATHIYPVKTQNKIELALRLQIIISTILMVPSVYYIALNMLPDTFVIKGVANTISATSYDAFVCVSAGAVGGLVIGLTTEYYTSKEYQPVKLLANSCKTGAATNIIYGLALGYKSVIVPVFVLASIVYVSFALCDLYGIALAAVGMLGNLATGLTIDAYGPVCDNAGGIAEMSLLPKSVREKTDALDAAGNTTAAVGKGFAIGSAALVSLALFGAFVTRLDHAEEENGGKTSPNVREILTPVIFAFLLIGAMIPYWFSALTMKSVGNAAMLMVEEVERQFKANPNLLVEGSTDRPDYKKCVEISTQASLKEMIAPGALVILTPLITGTFFGTNAVCAVLTGSLLSSVMLAISMSNTGGAWDNAKKYIELNPTAEYGAKGGDCHKAAVVGDTVGDPLKDTSGPALNIVMKLMAIISLVFANYFYQINDGHGLFGVPNDR
mmetsp:Transcript_5649/g.5815  ORF Transcript_5649/g.5815 Transcript_5649/m.5815 type:complete len:751 (-) Transcript_5649:169-2421(-)